ncbi:hypothetical protein TorRG33x02_072280, partial [Trema orientale]
PLSPLPSFSYNPSSSLATTSCILSRHVPATCAPPCPSYTPKKSTLLPPLTANPTSALTASSISLLLPITETTPYSPSRVSLDKTTPSFPDDDGGGEDDNETVIFNGSSIFVDA